MRVLRAMRREAHRPQHVRRLERARRAGRAGRHRDAFEVERDQQRLGLDAVEADVGRVRHARVAGAVDRRAAGRAPGPRSRGDRAARDRRAASVASLPAASVARRRRGRRSPATFSVPARRLRSCLPPVRIARDARAALDPQRAGALRAVELVRRERQQVDAERAHVHRNLADRLHGVGVKQRAARVRDAAPARRSAGSCRSRCWRASPTRAPSRRSAPPRGPRARRCRSCRPGAASSSSRAAPAP